MNEKPEAPAGHDAGAIDDDHPMQRYLDGAFDRAVHGERPPPELADTEPAAKASEPERVAVCAECLGRPGSGAQCHACGEVNRAAHGRRLSLAHHAVVGAAHALGDAAFNLKAPPATWCPVRQRGVPDKAAFKSLRALVAEFGAALDEWERLSS